ncbi:MAG: hypothetical protein U5O39_10145 [Gammaproteobacteria bacterium]|nr:hypothetical protein [Gammaproteobacteria bacterium]
MLGLSVGRTSEEIAALGSPETCDSFDETDKLVLCYTDTLTRENHVDDVLYEALSATFHREELIELCMAVAMAGMVNRVHATFHTEVDRTTRDFLDNADA